MQCEGRVIGKEWMIGLVREAGNIGYQRLPEQSLSSPARDMTEGELREWETIELWPVRFRFAGLDLGEV
jgi:hypothetical protein